MAAETVPETLLGNLPGNLPETAFSFITAALVVTLAAIASDLEALLQRMTLMLEYFTEASHY